MKLFEAIEKLNSNEIKVPELADTLGCSKDLLGDVLKGNGYIYNSKTQKREYVGDSEPENVDLNLIIEERKSSKGKRVRKQPSTKNQKKVQEKSDKNTNNSDKKEDLSLTENEIKWVKEAVKKESLYHKDFLLNYEFSQLPPRKPTKKANYEISNETFEHFEEFAKKIGEDRRMSRNDMVEIALRMFIENFRNVDKRF